MSLEDFFTLTEMKEGLSSLSRVKELVTVMQQEKDCAITNIGDAARQWSTVTSTLAATESKDCLDHFIQLDGLHIFNKWLLEVKKSHTDGSDNTPELIEALLISLEKFPYNMEKVNESKIGDTIMELLSYNRINIKERAKTLLHKWNLVNDDNVSSLDNAKDGACPGDIAKNCKGEDNMMDARESVSLASTARVGISDGSHDEKCAMTESHHSNVTFCLENLQVGASNVASSSKDPKLVAVADPMNSAGADVNLSNSSANLCSSPDACKGLDGVDQNIFSVAKDDAKEIGKKSEEASPVKSSLVGTSENSEKVQNQSDSKPSEEHCIPRSSEPEQRNDVDFGMAKHSSIKNELKFVTHLSKDTKEHSRQRKGVARSSSDLEGLGSVVVKARKGLVSSTNSIKAQDKEKEKLNHESSLEFDEEFDPLAIARQVAIEVEREVVDYREPFCSSPEANSGETKGRSSQSEPNEYDRQVSEDVQEHQSSSTCASSPEHESSEISKDDVPDPERSEQDLASEKLTSTAHVSPKKYKKLCDFDLNDDVFTEEFYDSANATPNLSMNLSAPKAIVAVSKGVPGLPVATLHFEGELGWKGSAATSAFRPASPRRTPDREKTHSKPNFLGIDLNVAENEDGMAVNMAYVKDVPSSSGIPSRESSMEVNSKRAERLGLDLNRIGDDEAAACPSFWKFNQQNGGDRCSSPTSSSSSRQLSTRDFNLNDSPAFPGAASFFSPTSTQIKPGLNVSSKVDNPVITIMGSRMSVEKKDYVSPGQQAFIGGNGPSIESMMATRPAIAAYPNMMPPAYAYNGYAPVHAMSIPPTFYGHGNIQYMVDSRGVPVIPQAIGSQGLPGPSFARPQLLMSLPPAAPSFGGVGSFRPGLDLNSGLTSVDNRSAFLPEEQSQSVNATTQPSTTGLPLKRKEPDYGWDAHPFGYKQVTSWQ